MVIRNGLLNVILSVAKNLMAHRIFSEKICGNMSIFIHFVYTFAEFCDIITSSFIYSKYTGIPVM